jgi:hypothetical protein
MERLHAGDIVLGWAVERKEADETNPFEALEHPTQRWAICRLLELVSCIVPQCQHTS